MAATTKDTANRETNKSKIEYTFLFPSFLSFHVSLWIYIFVLVSWLGWVTQLKKNLIVSTSSLHWWKVFLSDTKGLIFVIDSPYISFLSHPSSWLARHQSNGSIRAFFLVWACPLIFQFSCWFSFSVKQKHKSNQRAWWIPSIWFKS